jgi:hypothetical protein
MPSDINAATLGLMLKVNGSAIDIENCRGRGVTCGQTSAPPAQPRRLSSVIARCPPLGMVISPV